MTIENLNPWGTNLSHKFRPLRASPGYTGIFTRSQQAWLNAITYEVRAEMVTVRAGRADEIATGKYEVMQRIGHVGHLIARTDTKDEADTLVDILRAAVHDLSAAAVSK